jgi:hypothetical protein
LYRYSEVLNRDNRFGLLIKLIRYHHDSFKGQAVANVLHGLAALETDLVGLYSVNPVVLHLKAPGFNP